VKTAASTQAISHAVDQKVNKNQVQISYPKLVMDNTTKLNQHTKFLMKLTNQLMTRICIILVTLTFCNCTFDKRETDSRTQNQRDKIGDFKLTEVNPKIGCHDKKAADIIKSQFKSAGYTVDDAKLGGRNGTVGEIRLTVDDELQLEDLTRHSEKIVVSFADISEWYSFDLYVNLDGRLRRKIILQVLTDVKLFGSGLKYNKIICDFDVSGNYECN
jgi:hypothetical protein